MNIGSKGDRVKCMVFQRFKDLNGMIKLGFSEISPPQSLLPSNVQILNLMLINLFIIAFIFLVIHCVAK